MLKDKGREDYYTFRIPYWDWRKEKQNEKNSPFRSNRLGESKTSEDGLPKVSGTIFNNWPTVCWFESNGLCNPTVPTKQLQRCPLNSCTSDNPLWPSDKEVQRVLALNEYDSSPYSKLSRGSFRNQLEGFDPLSQDDLQVCRDNKLCMCGDGDFNCTEGNNETPILRLLHNSVSHFSGALCCVN